MPDNIFYFDAYSITGNKSNDIFPGVVITSPTQGAAGNIYDVAS